MTILDLSSHDESTFAPACFRANGVTRVLMGCQFSGMPARRMIPRLLKEDIEVRDVYAFLGFKDWWIEPTGHAISVAREFDIPKVWLDAEADDANTGLADPDVTPGQRITRLQESVNMVLSYGLDVGIYTASWWWKPRMLNTTQFARLPLWLGGPYQATPITEVDFGGWREVAIHQYTSSLQVCGRGRDANYSFEEESMTPEERDQLARLVRVMGDQQMDEWIKRGNVPLLTAFDMEQKSRGATTNSLNTHIAEHPAMQVEDHTHGGVEKK